jgi:predicted transcriptional regulator
VHGEERTNASNNEALLIEVCFKKRRCMRRSKLEIHVDILKVLVHWGPLKMTHVMYKVNVNCSVLEGYFELLIKRGLVEVKTVGKGHKVYVITQRGVTVLKQFKELREELPIVEETANKLRH